MKTLSFILCVFLVTNSFGQKQQEPIIKTVDAKTFQNKLKENPNAVLLDVRTAEEVSKGTIPGAVNIDFNAPDFTSRIASLAKDKTYFVYCAKGGRSSKATEQMSDAGFKTLYNLEGGFVGWQEKGMPVQKK
jgi:phage shock protein E